MKDPAAALSSLMLVLLGWTLLVVSCSDAEPTIDASIIHLPGEGDAPSGPVMAWDATTRDLGIVAAGSSHDLSYTVTNAGDAPMVITQVLPSCGCTVAEAWRDAPIAQENQKRWCSTSMLAKPPGPCLNLRLSSPMRSQPPSN